MKDKTLFFKINDAKYAYQVIGQGQPVVLLHGFTGTKSTWSTVIEKLKFDFQFITIDLPGHGETITPSPRDMKACCADLAELFKHLDLSCFHLLGYSLGGRTALSFALFYPEMIDSLILESASPGLKSADERMRRRQADEKLAQNIETMGLVSFVNDWENIPLFASQKKLPTEQRQIIRRERLMQSERGLAQSLRMMGTGSQPSWWDKLRYFSKPVLLVVGEKDHKFIKINQEIAENLPHAELKIIKEAGHAVHIEQIEPFFYECSVFLSRVKCN